MLPADLPSDVVAIPLDNTTRPVVFTFTIRALPGAVWERLLTEHRPSTAGFDYNPDTFPPAVIVEAVTGWSVTDGDDQLEHEERPPTLDEATELWTTWPQFARIRLLRAIETQNLTGASLGKAFGRRNAKPEPGIPATT